MALPRPSLTLVLDVDERLDSTETRLEIDRCYAHVGTTIVRTHKAGSTPARSFAEAAKAARVDDSAVSEEAEAKNVARLLVKLGTRKYLRSENEGADELWNDVVAQWLFNEFHKIGNNLQIFNRRQKEIGGQALSFDWLDVELQDGEVCAWMRLDSESGIDPDASEQVTRMRTALNAGVLGQDVASVVMPDPEDYKRQREAGLAAKAEREAAEEKAREEEEAAAAAAREEEERLAEEAFLESPSEELDEEEERARQEAELAAKFELPAPDFPIDYHLWRVEYADGTARTFDSRTGTFVA